MNNWMRPGLLGVILASGLMQACGDDDKKDDDKTNGACVEGENCSGNGWSVKAAAGSAVLDFSAAEAGAQFVVMPFALGDVATVNGATAENFQFTVTPDAGGAGLVPFESPVMHGLRGHRALPERGISHDHGLRTLLNRFDPDLGMDQGEWFWRQARRLDRHAGGLNLIAGRSDATMGPVESYFHRAATRKRHSNTKESLKMLAPGGCPDGELTVPDPDNEATDVTIPDGAVVDGDSYCIVYVSEPVTESDKDAIKASIEEILRIYKDVIYKDQFADKNGFTFKPVIAVIDFSDEALWPSKAQISGAFVGAMASEENKPMLYMAADFKKLEKNASDPAYDAALNKKLWHSTLAHEVQHAIMDYYRKRANAGTAEVPSIDEGLAHYMEDLFGYGTENFAGFAKGYIDVWTELTPFIHSEDDDDITRGGAQAFLYYLISQKGGVTFADGKVSGGGGLTFISDIVKSHAAKGPANLSAKFGGAWSDTVSNFYGALVLDGTKIAGVLDRYKVQNPDNTLKDLSGNAGKTYGMHFNGFGGIPETRDYSAAKIPGVTKTEEGSYYATKPLLYTVGESGGGKVTIAGDAALNHVVSVVRIK